MGLDITWYRNLRPLPDHPESDACWDEHVRLYDNSDFSGRFEGLVARCYEQPGDGQSNSFRAGSYSGYNRWRENLCRLALGVLPETIWGDPNRFIGLPFYEIINFADNEGAIGPVVSAKLARDFAEFRDKAQRDMHEWDFKVYDNFQRAFEAAANDGAVQFH
jgi:hypothetical protein